MAIGRKGAACIEMLSALRMAHSADQLWVEFHRRDAKADDAAARQRFWLDMSGYLTYSHITLCADLGKGRLGPGECPGLRRPHGRAGLEHWRSGEHKGVTYWREGEGDATDYAFGPRRTVLQ